MGLASEFCRRLTHRERTLDRIPTGYEYRLPTEAHWEYACRAGTETRFSYGEDPEYEQLGGYCWYWSNSENTTYLVGGKRPNNWGLYDMHGNVWEWCSDWYGGGYSGEEETDPFGPSLGIVRIVRGGGHFDFPESTRSSMRFAHEPEFRRFDIGFRVALIPIPGKAFDELGQGEKPPIE